MARLASTTVGVICTSALVALSSVCFAEIPSIEDVLKVCRENRNNLNPFHVQLKHIEERTEAYSNERKQHAYSTLMLLMALENPDSAAEMEKQMPGINSPQYKQSLRQDLKVAEELAKSVRFERNYEFFIDGENYQVRSSNADFDDDQKEHAFPDVSLSPTSLRNEYADFRIYSRSSGRTPVAQIWPGQSSPDQQVYAMNSSKHIAESHNMQFPPLVAEATHPTWDMRHPIDTFFSAPDDRYTVAGQEVKDGRLLTIVDVAVPTELTGGSVDENGQPQQVKTCYWYRAWLDMERGGIPLLMHFWHGTEGRPYDERFKAHPTRILKTTEIKKLANSAYFPAATQDEEFNIDSTAPALTDKEWKEVWTGTRESPPYVVSRRYTWECTNIDTNDPGGDEFFVLKFPEGQKFFDLDTSKVIGALEHKPFVKVGQPAPAWTVARWLDGKQHSLEEFRGKVVVLDFWGLWCSACRNNVPALAALQEKFKDKPVVFVSIHTAEGDADNLAQRIEKYRAEHGWHFLAAIDAGTMLEDSATSHEYGCQGFPTQVIIGADGIVKYNSDEPPPGMEDVVGKPCDETTPEDEAKMNAFMQKQFEEAGEPWPLPEDISQEEMIKITNRMAVFMMTQKIEAALAEQQ